MENHEVLFVCRTIHYHSWQRVSNPLHILWRPLAILSTLPYPPPFQIFSNFPPFLVASHLNPFALFVVLFLSVNGWLCHVWCANLLNVILCLHMLSLSTLVPEGPCCVFYATRHQVYWGMTHNVVFCWYSDLISHTNTSNATMDQ